MNYSKHVKYWLEFLKFKIETAKRLIHPTHQERYEMRVNKLNNKKQILDLDYEKLKELLPILNELKGFFSLQNIDEMSGKFSPEDLIKREVAKFDSLGGNKKALVDYLQELETLMGVQQGYTGRKSEKITEFPYVIDKIDDSTGNSSAQTSQV